MAKCGICGKPAHDGVIGHRSCLLDMVRVVRCVDCVHYSEDLTCKFWPDEGYRDPEHYCGEGVRREEE